MSVSREPSLLTMDAVSLTADAVLEQVEMAVIVTDRYSNVIYWNAFAHRLLGFTDDEVLGRSIMDVGIAGEDHYQALRVARHVLRGGSWEGTFCNVRRDGSRIFTRVRAVPRREPSGEITGVVICAREALKEGKARKEDRLGLLSKLGDLLSASLGLEATLTRVADILVPQFGDHCFVDLMNPNDDLLRRYVSRHTGGWRPPPGTWAEVSEVVQYPEGHFCRLALEREEAILIEDLQERGFPAPSDASAKLCRDMRVRSVIAAPLVARGILRGVLSLSTSRLGDREDPVYDGDDHSLIWTVASRIALAIDNALLFEEERRTALTFQRYLLPEDLPRLDGLSSAHIYEPAEPLIDSGVQTQVGGDWYDVIPLSAGRVGIVIGDVEGRGPRAAALMGQLRAAVRALALFDLPPAEVLERLEEWVRSFGRDPRDWCPGDEKLPIPLVTCLYLVYDAWSRQLWFANAGHASPLLAGTYVSDAREASANTGYGGDPPSGRRSEQKGHVSDAREASANTGYGGDPPSGSRCEQRGRVRELDLEPGPPLGVRHGLTGEDRVDPYVEQTCTLPPGTTLLLYTDGLIERRPSHFDGDAPEVLREKVAAVAHEDAATILDAAVRAVPGDIDDDVAVLVLRTQSEELPAEERTFQADPILVSDARRMAAEAFARWGVPEEQAEIACLLVSEVATNAVRHASITPALPREQDALADAAAMILGGDLDPWETSPAAVDVAPSAKEDKQFTLRLRRGGSALWAEVFDRDLRLPRIRRVDDQDEGGRGLHLVESLATRWGSRATRDGKWVWFEIAL